MWQLVPENNGLPNHLVHVPLKDSPLSDCGGLCGDLDIQIELEDSVCMVISVENSNSNELLCILFPSNYSL